MSPLFPRRGNPPVVILGGDANAISVARSLGAAGVTVYAIGSGSEAVQFSRYCAHFIRLAASDVQAAWMDWLKCRGPQGAVLLPCTDDGLELIARHRPELEALGYRPVEATDQVILAMLDKERTYSLARDLGVRAPNTITLRSAQDLEAATRILNFPCALKPLHSHRFAQHFRTKKAFVVNSPTELREVFTPLQALGLEMLATEIVSGGDGRYVSYYTYLDELGHPLIHFTKHKIRQFPTGFGLATFQVSTWDPLVAELGLRFCQGVGLRGLAAVEFKYDHHNRPFLIECNHRFTAANELVRLSGVDLALIAYARAVGHTWPEVSSFKQGVYMWNPIQDVRALRSYRRDGALSILGWVGSLLHPLHFPVAHLSDPLPTLGYHWLWLLRGVRQRSSSTSGSAKPALVPSGH